MPDQLPNGADIASVISWSLRDIGTRPLLRSPAQAYATTVILPPCSQPNTFHLALASSSAHLALPVLSISTSPQPSAHIEPSVFTVSHKKYYHLICTSAAAGTGILLSSVDDLRARWKRVRDHVVSQPEDLCQKEKGPHTCPLFSLLLLLYERRKKGKKGARLTCYRFFLTPLESQSIGGKSCPQDSLYIRAGFLLTVFQKILPDAVCGSMEGGDDVATHSLD